MRQEGEMNRNRKLPREGTTSDDKLDITETPTEGGPTDTEGHKMPEGDPGRLAPRSPGTGGDVARRAPWTGGEAVDDEDDVEGHLINSPAGLAPRAPGTGGDVARKAPWTGGELIDETDLEGPRLR
jgi:hypothetical protein